MACWRAKVTVKAIKWRSDDIWREMRARGRRRVNYKIRDWLIQPPARCGAPIPIVYGGWAVRGGTCIGTATSSCQGLRITTRLQTGEVATGKHPLSSSIRPRASRNRHPSDLGVLVIEDC